MKNKDLLNNEVAEIEIHYKTKVKSNNSKAITCSKDCADIFFSVFDKNTIEHREFVYAMYLNRVNKVLAVNLISIGGIAGVIVDIRIVLQGALLLNATNLILCHNHPSNNILPSQEDIQISKRLKEAAKLIDITLIDNLIINSEGGYKSFADEGIL